MIDDLLLRSKKLSWAQMQKTLEALGYELAKPGKTGGSRRRFKHPTASPIILHEPHPEKTVKEYAVKSVIRTLRQEGLI